MATTLHQCNAAALVNSEELPRLEGLTPALFDAATGAAVVPRA